MTNLAGQTIKDYELLERIGDGEVAEVYRAYQSTLGREVAMKVIRPVYANRPEFIRLFECPRNSILLLPFYSHQLFRYQSNNLFPT